MKALALAVLLASGCVRTPPHTWPKRDIALAAVFVAASVVDWHQTVKKKGIFYFCDEMNPMLGECGERMPIGVYFPLVWTGTGAIASSLPDWYRTAFLGTFAAVETENIRHNQSIGYGW